MSKQNDDPRKIREVVAVFNDAETLEAAVNDLDKAGFVQTNMSIMADAKAVAEKLGHRFEPVEEMEDDPKVPRRAFVDRSDRAVEESIAIGLPLYIGAMAGAVAVVASGGAAAMVALAATGGGALGGGLGALFARSIGKAEAERLAQNVENGGILLWVAVSDTEAERRAKEVLKAAGGTHVHAHEIAQTWEGPEIPFEHWNPDPFLLRS